MGMSTYVIGIKPPDAKWKKMKEAYDACEAAGVDPPKAVTDFFNGEEPDASGVVVQIKDSKAVTEWHAEMESGYQVDLTKLPKDITAIRFYNSW